MESFMLRRSRKLGGGMILPSVAVKRLTALAWCFSRWSWCWQNRQRPGDQMSMPIFWKIA